MFKNYLNIAYRNLIKHKFYSSINILGLSVGLTCFLFITLFITHELTYDKHFSDSENVYRMDFSGTISGNEFITALMSAPAAKTMKNDFPEVIDATRFRLQGDRLLKRKDASQAFKEDKLILTDPNVFQFWGIEVIAGDASTALTKPNTLAMNQSTATKIFGSENPIGQIVTIDNTKDYEVTVVYEDIPTNSHFHYNLLTTMVSVKEAESNVWMGFNFNTYLKLADGSDPTLLQAKFPDLIETKIGPEIKQFMNMTMEEFVNSGNKAGISLMPLNDIHLHSNKLGEMEANGDIKYIYIFGAIGAFILVLACINFMNLATARSANRAKEVGLRKVMGAYRGQLIGQFIAEAMTISFLSTITAFGLAAILLPYFNELAGKELPHTDLFSSYFLIIIMVIMVVVGLLSGSYPAFYLSHFQPVETLKGKLNLGMKSGGIRSILVVLQFTVSIIMIIGTAIVFDQLSYIQNKKLGFNKDQVIMINDAWLLGQKTQSYKNEALRNVAIEGGTVASFFPVGVGSNNNVYFPGQNQSGNETYVINNHYVDHDYIETMKMSIVEGRYFSKDFPSDTASLILNESAVKHMGISEPLGSFISTYGGNSMEEAVIETYKVIGVVEDFHYESLKEEISPLLFHLGERKGYIAFRVNTNEINATVDHLNQLWEEFAPGQPFSYSFMDEKFDRIYDNEQQIGKIFSVFSFLAIFIACLGLFGLASFTAEQRRKEIGIRKVLGASISQIIVKLSFNFLKLVGVSFVLASPIAYYFMKFWLDDFVYRTDIKIWIFIAAGILSAAIAWLTMGYQSWKAARMNPVTSLRNE